MRHIPSCIEEDGYLSAAQGDVGAVFGVLNIANRKDSVPVSGTRGQRASSWAVVRPGLNADGERQGKGRAGMGKQADERERKQGSHVQRAGGKRATGQPFASWGAVDCCRTSERERCPPPAVFARLGRCSHPEFRDAYFRPRVAIQLGAHILPPTTMSTIQPRPRHIPCHVLWL